MKLIVEIETADDRRRPVQLGCAGDKLFLRFDDAQSIELQFDLAEFRRALDAVAPKPPVTSSLTYPPGVRSSGTSAAVSGERVVFYGDQIAVANPYARNPDGSRNGPSPRDNMRARKPTPEANVEMPEEETAA